MIEGSSAFLSYLRLQGLGRELARASVSNAVVRTSREAPNIKSTLFDGVTCRQIQNKWKKQEQDYTSLSLFKSADPCFTTKQTQSLQKPRRKCCSACADCQFFLISETVFFPRKLILGRKWSRERWFCSVLFASKSFWMTLFLGS